MLETLLPEQTYFTIGEVARMTLVRPYVIRYWESQFGHLRPARRESGQRKFTKKEVDAILKIKDLLYEKKFTISGAKRFLKEEVRRGSAQVKQALGETAENSTPSRTLEALRSARNDLEEALRLLKG
jgi:DNA-binding transcriptional MerR regulator